MSTELSLAVPSFADLPPEEVTAFAAQNLELMRGEAESVKSLTLQAAERAWAIGKACVHLKDNGIIQSDLWEEWAKQNIGGGDYLPVYRSMRFYRMSPERPPGRASAQFKQLQIMFGDEPMPKLTPRKTDGHRFLNWKTACSAMQRFWRGGDAIKGVDLQTKKEMREDLAPLVSMDRALEQDIALEEAQ